MNRSKRNIEPELITYPLDIAKNSKIHDIKHVEAEKREEFNKRFKPNQSKMKRVLNFLQGVVTGDNKAGETVHGILDLLPIPNQIIAKGFSYLFEGETDKAQSELNKLLTARNAIALVGALLVWFQVVTIEDVRAFIEILGELV